ncbi:spermatogenesis-associated protein 1 [Elysia marginata]|uniref:Spermatogenesis-associated protein 1 n=1 Tax=Elysia marginata TaxID=1093978 RepID=A0AAV4HC26_9GAST|nr:spermatogenesis-associated protein 1 [Elysia marginata]
MPRQAFGNADFDKSQRSVRDPASPVNKYYPLPHIDPTLDSAHHNNKSAHSQTHRNNPHPSDPGSQSYHPYDPFSDRHYSANQNRRNTPTQKYRDNQHVPWAERAHNQTYVTSDLHDWDDQWQQQQPQTREPEVRAALPPAAAAATAHPREPWDSRGQHTSPDKFGSSRDFNRRPDDDSGVAEMSPDDDYNNSGRGRRQHGNHISRKDDYDMLAKRLESDRIGFGYGDETEEDRRRRLEELEGLSRMDGQRWDNYQDDRRRQAEEDRRREEDERRRREDEEKRRREEEEEKRRRDEENRLEEERRKRKEEEEEEEKRQQAAKEEAERLREESPDDDPIKRDTESAKQRRREEKIQLLRELEEARQARQEQEKEREELVKKAKALQHKTTNRRNDARDMWKKKYFEEKKKTAPLEENSNRLRQELEALHRRLMNTLEGPKEKNARLIDASPSRKNNYVIQCTKLQHDIEDLQRRVSNAKMKLTAEMKLRGQAQTELKAVRTEAMQNRLTLKLATGHARPSKLAGSTHTTELHAAAAQ